jgi:hypothetical protein
LPTTRQEQQSQNDAHRRSDGEEQRKRRFEEGEAAALVPTYGRWDGGDADAQGEPFEELVKEDGEDEGGCE